MPHVLPHDRHYVSLEESVAYLRPGDLLFCRARPGHPMEQAISTLDNPYCHVAMATACGTVLEVDWPAGREVPLPEWLERRLPGYVDVYRINGFCAPDAVDGMRRRVGVPYGIWSFLCGCWRALLRKLSGTRLMAAPTPKDCSDSILIEIRASTRDNTLLTFLPNPPGVTPSHLAHVWPCEYQFTLGEAHV